MLQKPLTEATNKAAAVKSGDSGAGPPEFNPGSATHLALGLAASCPLWPSVSAWG